MLFLPPGSSLILKWLFPCRYAMAMAKLAARVIALLRLGSGSTVPGRLALKLNPTLLQDWFANQAPERVIAITGTNGKTTTAGLLAAMLEKQGLRVVHNTLGANMLNGIASALVMATNANGKIKADAWVLEVDEASLRHVAAVLPIRDVLITNLFRDQLDRYGELDTTARFIAEGIEHCQPNGKRYCTVQDDTLRGMIHTLHAKQPKAQWMGLAVTSPALSEHPPALLAQVPCRFEEAAWERPVLPVVLDETPVAMAQLAIQTLAPNATEGVLTQFDATGQQHSQNVRVPLAGRFNASNALAALAVALDWGVPLTLAEAAMEGYAGVFGRSETLTVQGKSVRVFLIKNPVGATEVCRTVAAERAAPHVLVALNDNDADGRDVSWIWDAGFEWLEQAGHITCTGQRAADMAVRLKYAGLPAHRVTVVDDLMAAFQQSLGQSPENAGLVVLPTYTALLNLKQCWQ